MTRIFLAGGYDRRLELLAHQKRLRQMGHILTSGWVDGLHADLEIKTLEDLTTLNRMCSLDDMGDIDDAEVVVCFTRPWPGAGSGHHVEYGYALAQGKRLAIVGEKLNIYHYLDYVRHFTHVEEMFDWLKAHDL